jgi:hypothetical protein
MWFALGLITLLITLAFQWRYRWVRPWSGQLESVGGVTCETGLRSIRGFVYGLRVAVDVPMGFRFELKRENGWDRFFKWTGLAVEFQFGHFGFDPLVYVASNDDHLGARFSKNTRLLHAAQHLFAAQGEGCRLGLVACANGRMWMEWRAQDWDSARPTAERLLEAAAAGMADFSVMAEELRSHPPDSRPRERDKFLLPSVLILCLSSGLAISGAVSWARAALESVFVVDSVRLWTLSLLIGSLLLSAMVVATLILLGRSARVHLVLLEVLLVGGVGALIFRAVELRRANMALDPSAETLLLIPIDWKQIEERRGRGLFSERRKYHRLVVRDWASAGDVRSITVSKQTYEQVQQGDFLKFKQREGYFGIRWAEFVGWAPRAVQPQSRHLNL